MIIVRLSHERGHAEHG
jgi:redox-sensitive bicupin YhaK (pirin superfamily)